MKITKVTLASLLLMSQLMPAGHATPKVEVSKKESKTVSHVKVHEKPKKKNKTVVVLKRVSRSSMRRVAQGYAIRVMKEKYNWGSKQFLCLNHIWENESHWQWDARNKRSGALGIPQAYPGHKMKSAGKDYKTNYKTQIKWGLNYIDKRYNTPCEAKSFRKRNGYY